MKLTMAPLARVRPAKIAHVDQISYPVVKLSSHGPLRPGPTCTIGYQDNAMPGHLLNSQLERELFRRSRR